MKCPFCDAELDSDAKFCTNCGKNLDTPEALSKMKTTEPAQVVTPETTPAKPLPPETTAVQVENNVETTTPAMAPSVPHTPQQPIPVNNKKSNKTLFIVLGIVGGFLVLFLIGIIVVMGLYISNVKSKITETGGYDTTTGDYSGYDFTSEGKIIKKVKDPMDHEIVIQEDSIYIIKVNTDYLYAEAQAMRDKAKIKTEEEVDKSNATDIQKQATKKAIDALSNYSYSKDELTSYLKDEHYDDATIKYVINNCGVDWKEQTAIKVKDALASGGSSKTSLLELLVYEGFNEDHVKEALSKNNYDFYEQAASDACFYKYTYKNYGGAKTREEAETLLRSNGYSNEEIKFALKTIYDELDY